jgi:tripartite-type tricarboxylate transporter receptor subunit TctC
MTLSRRSLLVAAALAPVAARAQSRFPDRPIRVIVPFGPGGLADVTIRVVGERLSARLGQQVVVVNQPGAAGALAARAVTGAAPDGYTLALLTNGTAVSVATSRNLGFDPVGDFAPISTLGFFDFVIVTAADHPYRSLGDVIAAARARPGALNIGTILPGSTQHLSAELLKATTGIDVAVVTHRTTPEAITALLRRDVDIVVDGFSAVTGQLRGGQLRALATTGARRSAVLPEVPTAIESGVAGYDVTSWNALFAPAAAPREAIERIGTELAAVLAEPAVVSRLAELGIEARGSAPADLARRLREDIERWTDVVARARIERT